MSESAWAWVESAEGVPSALAAARDGIDAVLRDRGLRQTTPESTAEALLRGALASARLAGSASAAEAVRAGAGDPLATAAVRISVELLGLAPIWRANPVQALARLHLLAGAGLPGVDPALLGRPADAAAAQRLLWLGRLLGEADAAPALAVAAVVHGEVGGGLFVELPGGDAVGAGLNGLVARAAERLVLASRGVDPTSVTVPEAGHEAAGISAYRTRLAGYRDGGEGGVVAWLMHCATAYAAGATLSPLND